MAINDNAVLANLSISVWTARKYDEQVSKSIEDAYKASGSGRYNKILIGREFLAGIRRTVNAARGFHHANTLPWMDNGSRLLPTRNYFDYLKEMDRHRDEFNRQAKEFLRLYPSLQDEARQRLGLMFLASDYPPASELESRYSFNLQILPVPHEGDFRVGLDPGELSAIREGLRQDLEQATRKAMGDLSRRLYGTVGHLVERLSQTDAVFRDSLIGNVAEICELIPRLNVTGDPALEEINSEVKAKLAGLSPEELRQDAGKRGEAARDARQILDKMKGYLPLGQAS